MSAIMMISTLFLSWLTLCGCLARISHQAAQATDKTRVFWSKVLIVENTVCYSSLPITVQAGLRVRKRRSGAKSVAIATA
jgi:hypothetical protein